MKPGPASLLIFVGLAIFYWWMQKPADLTLKQAPPAVEAPIVALPREPAPAAQMPPSQIAKETRSETRTESAADTLPPIPEDVLTKKRSIARYTLSAGYAAAKSFHAEYGRYSSDLNALGFQPSESWLEYKFGFVNTFSPDEPVTNSGKLEDPRQSDSDIFLGRKDSNGEVYTYREPASRLRLSDYSSYCQTGCGASKEGFELMIAVPLDDSGRVDVWTINEKKNLILVHDGTK